MTSELLQEWKVVLNFSDVYIYGAAKTAESLYELISQMGYKNNIKGFLVTDGEKNVSELCGLAVTDIHYFSDKGVRVLVPHQGIYKKQVCDLLNTLDFSNVFCVYQLREKTALEEGMNIASKYEQVGYEMYAHKAESEKQRDKSIREQILNILQEGQPDFGAVKPYQSMELIGLKGMRPTEYRIRTYELRRILSDKSAVLDIGSNLGFLDISIAGLVQSLTGIEYDANLVKIANLVANYLNVSNCTFYNGDFSDWFKDADASYDVIFSFAVHHWLNLQPQNYVAAIDSLLKAGGYLCFESHVYGEDIEFDECYKEFLKLGYCIVCEKKINDEGIQERLYVLFQKKC